MHVLLHFQLIILLLFVPLAPAGNDVAGPLVKSNTEPSADGELISFVIANDVSCWPWLIVFISLAIPSHLTTIHL